jgi:hypothetical protein
MKQLSAIQMFLASAILVCGVFTSADWSRNDGPSLSIEPARRPATPMSVAGVARRNTRRAVVGGAAVGAAAAGTACVRVLVNGTYVCR